MIERGIFEQVLCQKSYLFRSQVPSDAIQIYRLFVEGKKGKIEKGDLEQERSEIIVKQLLKITKRY